MNPIDQSNPSERKNEPVTPDRQQADRNLKRPQRDGEPSLPHERDESPGDAVKPGDNEGASRELIEQAEEDVEAGKVDTDRGIPSNVPHR